MAQNYDTRLLSNLIKSEKDAQASFKAWTKDASSANAALNAWSLSDPGGDSKDLLDATSRVSQLLNTLTNSQRAYLSTLTYYLQSLTTLQEAQASLRTVLRDREILITRLIKISNKKPSMSSDGAIQAHEKKLVDAQRELEACEAFLKDEEKKLEHLRKRCFGNELGERMGKLVELGDKMREVGEEAGRAVERFVIRTGDRASNGEEEGEDRFQEGYSQYPSYVGDDEEGYSRAAAYNPNNPPRALSDDGQDSITPSHSASQARSPSPTSSNYSLELQPPPPLMSNGRPSSPLARSPHGSFDRSLSPPPAAPSPLPPPIVITTQPSPQPNSILRSRSPQPQPYSQHMVTRKSSAPSGLREPPPPPRPIFPVPSAPKSAIQQQNEAEEQARGRAIGMPSFEIPKAPVSTFEMRQPEVDSSDEEDQRAFEAMKSAGYERPSAAAARTGATSAGASAGLNTSQLGRLRRRAMSDTSSVAGGSGKSKGKGFFGGLAALFKRKEKSYDDDDDDRDDYRRRGSTLSGAKWETRTDKNLSAVQKSSALAGRGGRRRNPDDSSDDERPSRNLVKVVNDPKARIRALSLSDVGSRPGSIIYKDSTTANNKLAARPKMEKRVSTLTNASLASTALPTGTGTIKKKKQKAASDIGVSTTPILTSPKTLSPPVPYSAPNIPPPLAAPPAASANRMSTMLESPPPLPSPTIATTPISGSAAPSLKKKKKSVIHPSDTIVVLATPDMFPRGEIPPGVATPTTAAAPRSSGLSRNNTVTSVQTTGTTGSGSTKKRKKVRVPLQTVASSLASSGPGALPTAQDLANTLPSARSSMYANYPALPLPTDAPGKRPDDAEDPNAGKAPKSLKDNEKRSRKESIRHGNETWVSHGDPHGSHGSHHSAVPEKKRVVAGGQGHAGEESLMSIVDRDEKLATSATSRSYGVVSDDANFMAIPRVPGSDSSTTGATHGGSGVGEQTLAKRKSVRLAEGSTTLPAHVSPPSSIRSESLAVPKHGILVHNSNNLQPPERNGSPANGDTSAWDTRINHKINGTEQFDSSDDEDEEYTKAKKAFAKGTRGLEKVFSGDYKGKGKEKA